MTAPGPGRVLLFGGTFDPPHRAHVTVPVAVADALDVQRIVYIPAARNPLKNIPAFATDDDRIAMLHLALQEVPRAEISTVEIDRGGPSYFVETLETLKPAWDPETVVHFLIGADQTLRFHDWLSYRRILDLAEPAVVLRPPWTADALRSELTRLYDEEEAAWWMRHVVTAPILDISATDIRRRLARGEGTGDLVDAEVLAYIRERGLYATDSERSRT